MARHDTLLQDGSRAGFFLGDGAQLAGPACTLLLSTLAPECC